MVLNVSVKRTICSALESVGLALTSLALTLKEQPAFVKILNKSMTLLRQFVLLFLQTVSLMMITLILIAIQDTRKKMEDVLILALLEPSLILLANVSVVEVSILKEMSARNQSNVHLVQPGIRGLSSVHVMSVENT